MPPKHARDIFKILVTGYSLLVARYLLLIKAIASPLTKPADKPII
jgi:hypothetical protein